MFQHTQALQKFPGIQGRSNLSLHLPGIGQPSGQSSAQSSAHSQSFHSHLTLTSGLGHSDTDLNLFDNNSGLHDVPGAGLVRCI